MIDASKVNMVMAEYKKLLCIKRVIKEGWNFYHVCVFLLYMKFEIKMENVSKTVRTALESK